MEDKIICNITMFSCNQEIIYTDGRKEKVPLDKLEEVLITNCYNLNINKIHFFGEESYINGLVENIYNLEKMNYNKNKIEIEVN